MKGEAEWETALRQAFSQAALPEKPRDILRQTVMSLPERKDRRHFWKPAAALGALFLCAALLFAARTPRPDFSQGGYGQAGGSGSCGITLSPTLQFPQEERAVRYTLEDSPPPEDLFAQAREKGFSVAGDGINGYWSITRDRELEGFPEHLPTDEEAAAKAEAFIREHRLFSGELGEPVISRDYSGQGKERRDLNVRVSFFPSIQERPVYGRYRITLILGDHGEIEGVFKTASPVGAGKETALKSQEEVRREVENHPEHLGFAQSSLEQGEGVVTRCRLAYYVDGNGPGYAYPIYVLEDEDGRCLALLDAVK